MDESKDEETPLMEASLHFLTLAEQSTEFDKNIKLSTVYEDDNVDEFVDDEDENKNLLVDFFSYIEKGDIEKVERAIENGISPNTVCPQSLLSACHFAAFFGHFKLMRVLLERGANALAEDIKGRTPLDMCVWNGHDMCLEILFEHLNKLKEMSSRDALIENEDSNDTKKYYDIETLIKAIEEMDRVWDHSTPIHLASARIYPNTIQILILNGYNPKMQDRNGLFPIDVCCEGIRAEELKGDDYEKFRFIETIKVLAPYCENTRSSPLKQSTPLHKAINMDSKEATKLLVDINSYRNSFDENGDTPLHLTILKKRKQLLQILLLQSKDKMADVRNREGLTPLHLAIKTKWRKAISVLLKAGANVLEIDKMGNSSMHFAAMCSAPNILQDVIVALPDKKHMDAKNFDEETPLFLAIQSGDDRSVNVLLNEKASIKIVSKNGYNPLHAAVKFKQKKILKLILAANAELPENEQILNEPCSTTEFGMAPIHLAAEENNLECFKVLLKYGANLKRKTITNSFTPLHIAALKGHLKIVELILNTDISTMEEYDFQCWKPFHRAVHKGHRDCVSLFLKKGADLAEQIVYRGKIRTTMQLLISNMPRAANYLEKIFDESISKNQCEIDDECCEITIDYAILMPGLEIEDDKIHDNQMGVVVALLNTGKRSNQRKLLLHPFIESFLYLKWKNGLRFFYGFLVAMYILFVLSFTTAVIRIYSYGGVKDWSCKLLAGFTTWVFFQEISMFIILMTKGKIGNYFKRVTSLINLMTAILSVVVLVLDHTDTQKNWHKALTGCAVFFAWLEVTILLSHFPECGYTFQMFSTVTMRALKVMAIFGIEVLIGFAMAFWVMFYGQPSFSSFMDSLVRTIVMTAEFDYVDLFANLENGGYRLFVQLIFVAFIFFVPIVMMNLILALIISDTNDLKAEGKIKRLTGQVRLIDILDTVIYFIAKKRLARLDRVMKIYPGKPSWEAISLVSNNLEEALFKRVKPTKAEDAKQS